MLSRSSGARSVFFSKETSYNVHFYFHLKSVTASSLVQIWSAALFTLRSIVVISDQFQPVKEDRSLKLMAAEVLGVGSCRDEVGNELK